jgi:7-carboxy-7-deazaguanine synthase
MLRVSEVFTTVQGEGPNTGRPVTFIRFGGCNLRCPGWGTTQLPSGEIVGACDTAYAVYPDYREEWSKNDIKQILKRIPLIPRHVCITGGEPLIQNPLSLRDFVENLLGMGYTIDLFTNGTKDLPHWSSLPEVTVNMDWKMPSSGEYGSFEKGNLRRVQKKDMIKFVIDPEREDDWEAFEASSAVIKMVFPPYRRPHIYVGPVWGTDVEKLANRLCTVDFPVRLNVQTHKYIFPPGVDGTSTRENTPVSIGEKFVESLRIGT